MIVIPCILKRSYLPTLAALFILLLSGCQILPFSQEAAPQQVVWTVKGEDIANHEFALEPNQNIVGALATVNARENDTLSDFARHYGLGYNDITLANADSEPWSLVNAQQVLLPLRFILPEAPHEGIVLNLANMRLFYYPKAQSNSLLTYPVGVGRQGWNTPLGLTQITAKKANPDWIVPESIKREHLKKGDALPSVVHAGPDNPLGHYALALGFSSILIHGTNKPYGIGMQVSHGCVQLYPEDIESLFNQVAVGTPVRIVHQPYLTAWDGDMLYLEAHPPLEKWANQEKQLRNELLKKLGKIVAEKNATLDWNKIERILQRADGIPTPILAHSADLPELTTAAVKLQHPEQLFSQPNVGELTDSDWAILAASFPSATTAQKFSAMLNHLDPQIPARMLAKNGEYQVLAGPFKDKKDTQNNAKRIKQVFEMQVTPVPPKQALN
jgi:L,D-transpeptidase ErfK/SrfK